MDTQVSPLYCFLDVETTGANRFEDEMWECTFQIEQLIRKTRCILHQGFSHLIQHTTEPSIWVLNNTKYIEQYEQEKHPEYFLSPENFTRHFLKICESIKQQTKQKLYLVGANPAFDDVFISRLVTEHYPQEKLPYDYHLIDVLALAQGHLHNPYPLSLEKTYMEICGKSRGDNYIHTATEDVQVTREIFYKILGIEQGV